MCVCVCVCWGGIIWAKVGQDKRGVEKTTLRRASLSAPLTKYYSGDQIKNEMGWACGTYERQGFGGETRGKDISWKT